MLVLSRRSQERIVIEPEGGHPPIVVTITGMGDGMVRLGFEAPPGVRIDREEIHQARRGQFLSPDELDGWQPA